MKRACKIFTPKRIINPDSYRDMRVPNYTAKTNNFNIMKFLYPLFLFIVLFCHNAIAQTDTTTFDNKAVQDTIIEATKTKKQYKRVSDFRIYGGVSTSKIILSNNSAYESAYAAGYNLGFSYRKGRLAYWELGLNYNNSVVTLDGLSIQEENMQIRQLEAPINVGINALSLTRRVLGVRIFGGVVPGYIAGIGDNPFDLVADDFNRFQFSGRVGVGVDVLFLFIEGGYQYGFTDLLKDQDSNLTQLDLKLGFRF